MSLPATFDLTPEDAQLLLAANTHLGARNVQVCFITIIREMFTSMRLQSFYWKHLCVWFKMRENKKYYSEKK